MNLPIWRDAAAWALLHLVWQGALVCAATASLLAAVPRRRATTRYVVALAAMTLLPVLPVATAGLLVRAWSVAAAAIAVPVPSAADVGWWTVGQRWLQSHLGAVLALWMAGVTLGALRFLRARGRVRRLVAESHPAPAHVAARFEAIRRRLAVARDVVVRVHPGIGAPALLRAQGLVVMVPPDFARDIDEATLDAVLAHELVHARRRDDRANAWQCLIEILCFHVPGIAALSRIARAERECCCDRTTVGSGVEVRRYARALASLAGVRAGAPLPAIGLADGGLLDRVSRLLAEPEPPRWRRVVATLPRLVSPLPLVALVVLAGWGPPPPFAGPITIAASDPAGPFTLRLQRGVVQAATVDGAPIPRSRIRQTGDSLRVLDRGGAVLLAVAIDPRGAIRWAPRPARHAID